MPPTSPLQSSPWPARSALNATRLLEVIDFQAAILNAEHSPDAVMRDVTTRAQELTRAAGAVIELVDGDELVCRVGTGSLAATVGLRLPLDASISGLAVRTARIQRCDDAGTDARVDQDESSRRGVRSMMCVPLIRHGSALGVLTVASGSVGAFDDDDVEVFRLIAGVVASAMTRATTMQTLVDVARTDALTGLPNRLELEETLARELARVRRTDEPMSVALIDLDHFKLYNDENGHAAGDALLQEAASRWRQCLRSIDVVARFGGEEFVLLLPSTDLAGADQVLVRLRAATPAGQTFSAGVVLAHGFEGPSVLLARADHGLYEAKRTGRNRTVFC